MCVILHGETSGAYYRGNMYCSPRDTRSRAHCDRLTVTEYTMCVSYCMGRLLGPITGGTCIVHPGTRAPEHTVTDLLSQNIRCVCHIARGDFWGLLPGEHVLFTPGHALQSTLRQTYCHRIYDVCVILHGQTSGAYYREHLRCLPRDAPLQRALRHACRQDTYCVLLTGYTVCY